MTFLCGHCKGEMVENAVFYQARCDDEHVSPVHWRCRWKIQSCGGGGGGDGGRAARDDCCHKLISYVWSVRKYALLESSQQEQQERPQQQQQQRPQQQQQQLQQQQQQRPQQQHNHHHHHPLMMAAFRDSFAKIRARECAKADLKRDKHIKHLALLAKHQEQRVARAKQEAIEDKVVQEAEAKGVGYMHHYLSFHEMSLRPIQGKEDELRKLLQAHGLEGVCRW